jgi:hypothetical protein
MIHGNCRIRAARWRSPSPCRTAARRRCLSI